MPNAFAAGWNRALLWASWYEPPKDTTVKSSACPGTAKAKTVDKATNATVRLSNFRSSM
jgi:hypothetical protein